MATTIGPLEQKVVIYNRPGQEGVVYDTVYTGAQARRAERHAIERHGRRCEVTTVSAAEHALKHRL